MKGKRVALGLSFLTAGLLTAVFTALSQQKHDAPADTGYFKAISRDGCRGGSWAPEVFSFYGDPDAVRAKLQNFDMHLSTHRVFMFIVESSNLAHVSLFEFAGDTNQKDQKDKKSDDPNFHVWTWQGNSAAELREKASTTILANKGVLCVGEQIKALVKGLQPEDRGVIPAPATGLSYFNHEADAFRGQYIRLTVFLLC